MSNGPKRILAAIGISVSVAVAVAGTGATGDHFLNDRIDLGVVSVTPAEYRILKPELINKMRMREKEIPYELMEMWREMVRLESRKCGKMELKNVNRDNLLDKINEAVALC